MDINIEDNNDYIFNQELLREIEKINKGIKKRKEKGNLFEINEKVKISNKYKNFWSSNKYINEIFQYQDSLAGQEFTVEIIEIDKEYYNYYVLKEEDRKIKWNEFLLEKI